MEITELKFQDYTQDQLKGMYVIFHFSNFGRGNGKALHAIRSVTKTQFKIEGSDNSFNIETGMQKGGSSFSRSRCVLISDYSVIVIRESNRIRKAKSELKKQIVEKITKYDLSIEKLESILLKIANS